MVLRLKNSLTTAISNIGVQAYLISLSMIANALPSKKAEISAGGVSSGRQGKIYLCSLNGLKKPTPNPASVNASIIPCEQADRNRIIKTAIHFRLAKPTDLKNSKDAVKATTQENNME